MQQSASGSFHTSFRTSFKSSFMKSCSSQGSTSQALCGCIEAALESKNSDNQLINLTSNPEELNTELGQASRTCAEHPLAAAPRSRGAQPGIDPERIGAYVTPYYTSTGPTIHVGRYSSGLASRNPSQVLATIGKMKAHWQQLGFPELYVGAIRLYDLGYRNDSVYWFYTAQYRGRQFTAFLDPAKAGGMGDPGFELRSANGAFMQTAGTWINGYAFGNIDGLIAIIRRVQSEGQRQIPDVRAIYPHVAFIERSRWRAANTELADGTNGFVAYMQQQRDAIKQQRVANGTEARFSHLTSKDLPKP